MDGGRKSDLWTVVVVTCNLKQNGFALQPGPGVIVAVPDPAAVEPGLLWAQAGHKQGSAAVGQGVVMPSTRVCVCLGGEDRSVEEPGHPRERAPADAAPQPGGRRPEVGRVEAIHLHRRNASHRDWSPRRQRRNTFRGGGADSHREAPEGSYPRPGRRARWSDPAPR